MPRAFRDDERAHIVAALHTAATDAMAGRGLRRTPVAELCRAAGISKGAFYGFYDSKEALAVAVLREAEAALRADLTAAADGPDALDAVLRVLFEVAPARPQLALLTRPDELQWLLRGLPEGTLATARDDDDAWFSALFDRLVARGEAHAAHREAFLGVPGAAMALAHGEPLLGHHAGATADRIREGLLHSLTAQPSEA